MQADAPLSADLDALVPAVVVSSSDPLQDASLRLAAYYQRQAQAIHRIYRLLHPDARIKYVLKALDGYVGAPDTVYVERKEAPTDGQPTEVFDAWETADQRFDDTYLGTYELGLASHKAARVVVIATIPRKPVLDSMHGIKTSPEFHQPVINWAIWQAPVLFEQFKYMYEKRELKERSNRHSFKPLKRPLLQRLGNMPDLRSRYSRPSILIAFHWLEMGGAEKLAFDTVKWARAAGFRVLVIADRPESQKLAGKLPNDPDIEFIRLDAYLPRHLWGGFLKNLVKAENIRAVHIHHNTLLYENLMRLKTSFPELVVIDSTHIIEYADGGYPRTAGVWTNYIDYHHVISQDLVGFFLNNFGVSGKVKLGRMLDTEKARAPLIEPKFNLKTGQKTFRVTFVGRMVHQKRAPLIVAIARKLKKWAKARDINLHFDMVGTGAYLDVVRSMIDKAGLRQMFTLHMPDANVPDILRRSDVLILPSSNEGLALVCYEAIENGAIPISTNVGGQSELMPADLMISLSPLKCVAEAAALVIRLFEDQDFLKKAQGDLVARYGDIRQDPTAEEVIATLYNTILSQYRDNLDKGSVR